MDIKFTKQAETDKANLAEALRALKEAKDRAAGLLHACKSALDYPGLECNCSPKCDGTCTYSIVSAAVYGPQKRKRIR